MNMKKILIDLSVLLIVLFAAAILLHAMDLLINGSPSHSSDLVAGNLHLLLTNKAFWHSFPSMPEISTALHLPSLLVAVFILGHAVYIWGVRKQLAPLPFGLVIWAYGLVPYGLGLWILRSSGSISNPKALWGLMLWGLLASTVLCGLSVFLGMIKIDVFKALTRVPMPHVKFKTQPVAES